MNSRSADRSAAGPVRAFLLLGLIRVSLKILGFRRTVRLTGRLAGPEPAGPGRASAPRTARVVAAAAAFFPGRAVCLEQALALFVLLRRAGHRAALRIGVQPFPFQAHAWIELDGQPLFEGEGVDRKFIMLPEVFA